MKPRLLATALVFGVLGLLLVVGGPCEVSAQTTYAVTIKVTGFPATLTTNVFLDGVSNGTMPGSGTRVYNFPSIPPVTHTLTVDLYVPASQGSNGTRYISRTNSWTFNGPANHEFQYTTQYFLTVQSEFASVTGQGWYDEGDRAYASVSVGEVPIAAGTQQVFAGWSGDATGTGLRSNEIAMDAPKSAVANWKKQFLLTITVNPGGLIQPEGGGWKDAGSTTTFNVTDTIAAGSGSRFVFASWSGDYSGPSPGGSILMDGPKTIAANYKKQYFLTVRLVPESLATGLNLTGQGWHDEFTTVAVGTAPPRVDVSSVERLVLKGWMDNGHDLGSPDRVNVYMDGPHAIDLVYRKQFLIRVQTRYGQAFGGDWYDEGTTATFGIRNVPSEWMVHYVFKGWNINPQASIEPTGDLEWQLRVDRPFALEAVWEQDYSPLYTIVGGLGAVGALIAVGTAVVLRRNRGLGLLPGGAKRKHKVPSPLVPPAGMKSCVACGARIPGAATFCHICGNRQDTLAAATESRAPAVANVLDDRVLNYIVAHEGVISLSKAARDLGISLDELKAATDRLKKSGRLS